MSSKEEWCADKLSKLINEDLRISTLTEIKEHFKNVSNTEAVQTAELLQLPLVFDCLNDSNKEQVDLACEVLSLCLEKLDIVEATNRYNIPLERALTHPNAGVKLMALEEIRRIVKCEPSRKGQLVSDLSKRSIFTNIIRCIGDEELKVAIAACYIVTCFATVDVDCFLTPSVLTTIKEVMGISEVIRLRCYEVFIDICLLDQKSHNKIISQGLLSPITHEISSKDVLLRVNIIAMLYKLVEVDYGFEYLEEEGFIRAVFKQLSDEIDPVFTMLCQPGILKFFGHMARCKPNQAFNNYPVVVDKIFDNLDCNDYTLMKVSLETIGFIAVNDKAALDSHVGGKMISAVTSVATKLQSLPTKEKVQCLAWLEELLKNPKGESSSRIAQKWFGVFSADPMDLVMHYVRNPFEELRLAGLGVLSSLTLHRWGQENMRNFPGLVEYLMDRNAEVSKISKDIKYGIVENLYKNNMGVFEPTTITSFETFLREGPHYVQAVTEVAIEGNE